MTTAVPTRRRSVAWRGTCRVWRLQPGYEKVLAEGRRALQKLPVVGEPAYAVLHGMKSGLKDLLAPQAMFTDLGISMSARSTATTSTNSSRRSRRQGIRRAGDRAYRHHKGMGYEPAENHEEDQMHATGVIDPATGQATSVSPLGWTDVFSAALIDAGRAAAISSPSPRRCPARPARSHSARSSDRLFDVGIAEQHALTSAAGLALGGLHPVVAIYLDVPQSGVRPTAHGRRTSQAAGDAGARPFRHHRSRRTEPPRYGICRCWRWCRHGWPRRAMPCGCGRSSPRRSPPPTDPPPCDSPKVLCPKISGPWNAFPTEWMCCVGECRGGAVRGDVLIVAVGAFCSLALDAADRLAQQGIAASVIDPRWVLPVPDSVVDLACAHRLVVTLEDGGISGGVGSAVAAVVADADVPYRSSSAIPQEFIEMGSRGEILADLGLTAQDLARLITATVSRMQSVPELGDDALAEAPADQPADSHADD